MRIRGDELWFQLVPKEIVEEYEYLKSYIRYLLKTKKPIPKRIWEKYKLYDEYIKGIKADLRAKWKGKK
jgi:hypothetical protein